MLSGRTCTPHYELSARPRWRRWRDTYSDLQSRNHLHDPEYRRSEEDTARRRSHAELIRMLGEVLKLFTKSAEMLQRRGEYLLAGGAIAGHNASTHARAMFAPHRRRRRCDPGRVRAAWRLSAVVELRRLFPGVTDNRQARECVRTIAGWQPLRRGR